MSEAKRPHGSRFRDALAIVNPGACNPSGIAYSIVEACREIREHEPTASTAHDSAIRLMVYQLASVCGVADYALERYTTDEAAELGLKPLGHNRHVPSTAVEGALGVGSIKETPMPKYAVEVQYLLPVWTCVIVDAENADAAQKAVMFDESGHTWDQHVEDYENSRASTVEGWREITGDYDVEDLEAATPHVLWDFIHEADQHEAGKALAERLYRVSMERPVNEGRGVVVRAASVADASKVTLTADFDESQLEDWTPCDPGDATVYDVEPVDNTEPLTPINGE